APDRIMKTPTAASTDPMIPTIPVGKTMDTIFQRGRGTETDVTGEVIDVRKRRLYVAGLHRQQFLLRGSSERLLQKSDDAHQLRRLVVADIVDSPWRRTGPRIRGIARPACMRLWSAIDQADNGFHHVIDEREIPLHVAMVEQLDRLPPHDRI